MIRNFGIVLLLGLMILSSCAHDENQRYAAPVKVKTETATTAAAEDGSVYVGQVEAMSSTAASFTGMGTIEEVCVSEGQRVSKGQLLAVMNAETALSALDAAKAQMDQANDAYARMKQLYDNGSLQEIKWVEVESNVATAKSQLAIAEKQVRDSRLLAPVSGVIGRGIKSAGETALPAAPVMNILDIDRVKIKIAVPEKEYSGILSLGLPEISVAAIGDELFHCSKIERGVEGNTLTHTYDVYLYVDNAAHKLLPGMVADVRFSAPGSQSAISLPVRAVRRNSEGNFVWTVRDGVAVTKPVTAGKITGNRIVIESGLAENDTIITDGYQKLTEGSTVIL